MSLLADGLAVEAGAGVAGWDASVAWSSSLVNARRAVVDVARCVGASEHCAGADLAGGVCGGAGGGSNEDGVLPGHGRNPDNGGGGCKDSGVGVALASMADKTEL